MNRWTYRRHAAPISHKAEQPTPQGVPLNDDAIAVSEASAADIPAIALRVAANRSDGKSPEMNARALIL
jgi:hypothetical protein